jgi:hypothetical protein
MSGKSGDRFSEQNMRQRKKRMSWKSGYRFFESDVRERKTSERIPVQLNRMRPRG